MSLIPKKIFQSWKTKELSPQMTLAVNSIKKLNPEYSYELSDDADCRSFILEHFGKVYASAFDDLIPGAFKSDFWRYAKLYIEGGVYMDIDFTELVPLNSILKPNDSFVTVVDLKDIANKPPCAIYQAFMACAPKHPLMLKAFELTYYNIINHSQNTGVLDITGPVMLGKVLNTYWDRYSMLSVKPGVYPDKKFGGNIRLLDFKGEYVMDGNGQKLFNIKYDGYWTETNANYYGVMVKFFKTVGNEWNRSLETYVNSKPYLSSTVENYKKLSSCKKSNSFNLQVTAVILIFISIIILYCNMKK
jgi:mannosyltransferase OCH1-like enzyme